tara:strand:+ start:448 stop:621 length:174 start_codon:yes stop_codon:yes gene_type:complete
MSLYKIMLVIVALWFLIKIKRFISKIKISAGHFSKNQNKKNRRGGMDIQDADYEDVK